MPLSNTMISVPTAGHVRLCLVVRKAVVCTRDCPNKLNVSRSSPKAAQSWGTVCLDVKVVQKYAAVDGINTCMFLLRVERKIYIYIY